MSTHHAVVTEHKLHTASAKRATLKSLLLSSSEARGAQFFSMCASCHTENKTAADGVGPNLWGVVLRRVASLPSFAYSPSLAKLSSSR